MYVGGLTTPLDDSRRSRLGMVREALEVAGDIELNVGLSTVDTRGCVLGAPTRCEPDCELEVTPMGKPFLELLCSACDRLLVDVEPLGPNELLEPLLRFLMTSVFKLSGLTTP